jgi:Ca2+/Na+ antiporter
MLSSFMISFNGSDIIHRITNANNGGSGSYFASIIFSFVTSSVEIIVTFTLLRSYKINTAISEITGSCLVNSFVLGLLGFIFSFTNKNGGEFYGEESTRLLTICLVISLVLMLIFLFS